MNITDETRRASYRQLKPQMRWGKILMTLKAVSYTHLDVYKRQTCSVSSAHNNAPYCNLEKNIVE